MFIVCFIILLNEDRPVKPFYWKLRFFFCAAFSHPPSFQTLTPDCVGVWWAVEWFWSQLFVILSTPATMLLDLICFDVSDDNGLSVLTQHNRICATCTEPVPLCVTQSIIIKHSKSFINRYDFLFAFLARWEGIYKSRQTYRSLIWLRPFCKKNRFLYQAIPKLYQNHTNQTLK